MALQLEGTPWRVQESSFIGDPKTLTLKLTFDRGSRFACPECGSLCPVHDTQSRIWRHLDFFQYRCELSAPVPRIRCEEHGVRATCEVPWAKKGSGFTLMMEAFIALLCQNMPVSEVADTLDEHDTRLWRLISELVERAHKGEDWSKVRRVLVDETISIRGHRYVTCFVDAESRRLLFLTEGKGSDTVEAFARELEARRGFRDQIELVCMDMSGAFAKGVTRSLPKARVAYDHFHIMQMAGKAVDEVRKDLRSRGAALKGALWALRGNVWNQSAERLAQRAAYCQQYPRLGSSIMLRETL